MKIYIVQVKSYYADDGWFNYKIFLTKEKADKEIRSLLEEDSSLHFSDCRTQEFEVEGTAAAATVNVCAKEPEDILK